MERVPTPTFPRVLGKTPGTKVWWEEEIKREVGPKIRGPTGPHERPSPEPSEELGLSFISPTYCRSGGLGLTSPPGPIPNFQICPRLSDAPGTLHTRRPKLHRPSPARLDGDREGQGHRRVGCPCGLPGFDPVAPPRGQGSGCAKWLPERLGGQGPR